MLNNHVSGLRHLRRRDEHRKALLAQLEIQSQQMLFIPQFRNVTTDQIEQYSSRSTPVIIAARQKHIDSLNELKKPWWKKLETGNEYESNDIKTNTDIIDTKLFISDHEKQF